MPSSSSPATVYLQVDSNSELPADDLDRAVRNLRRDLSELEVGSVDFVRDESAPAGAKGGEVLALGSLAVVVLPVLLPKLVEFLQTWLLRGENRRVKMKLQLHDKSVELEYVPGIMSTADVKQLVAKVAGALGG
jgi:hypothetical protein